jgi:hypothetical protein
MESKPRVAAAGLTDVTNREADQARVRAAYRNDNFVERACDCCGRLYRGPAVYCSLDCTLADA